MDTWMDTEWKRHGYIDMDGYRNYIMDMDWTAYRIVYTFMDG